MESLVLVANRATAKVFEAKKNGSYELLETFENELGREKNRELMTDAPGQSRISHGRGGTAHSYSMTGEKDPHEEVAESFAKYLGEFLDRFRSNNDFKHLVVVAEPKFLGLIRGNMSKQCLQRAQSWVKKDLINLPKLDFQKALESIIKEHQDEIFGQ